MATVHRQKLDFQGKSGQTKILIGEGVLAGAAQEMADWLSGRRLFVVTTRYLWDLHGSALQSVLRSAVDPVELFVADGEAAKAVEVAHRLWDEMLAAGGKRDSRLLTFGGGTVGDVGGFVAGGFLRGIEYTQVPTTLLAQVDAALGGKTGVDLEGGKNTVGLFHHPAWVLSDTSLLATLPSAELRSGLVEVVKMAALLDPPLLERVEESLDALLAGDAAVLAPVIAAAAAAKAGVVERDEREGDLRRVLNFGHTLGHAIEGVLAYEGLRHGEAVAYGMLFALRLAERRALVAPEAGKRLRVLLRRFELPALPELSPEALYGFMTRDKKATEGGIAWVLPASPADRPFGGFEIAGGVGREEVMEELPAFLASPFAPSVKV